MKKMIHIVEGTTLNQEVDGGGRTVSFAADIVDEHIEMDAAGLVNLIKQCSAPGVKVPSEADVQRMMDGGANTFVVEHVGDRSLMHFIEGFNVQPVHVVHASPPTMQ